ncbi:MAG: hypothetical protein AAF787_23015 [Chloroflexota bacterium]
MGQLIMIVFGIIALTKGSFRVIGKRRVTGQVGRIAGAILLVGGLAGFLPIFVDDGGVGTFICFSAFLVAIVLGLATAKTPEQLETDGKKRKSEGEWSDFSDI